MDLPDFLKRISVMQIEYIGNGKGRDTLDKISDKQYTPRILKDLFDEK